jgi:hypothetical protein
MSTSTTIWVSKTFVVDWYLTDLAGTPTNGTVAGTVTKPDGSTAPMTVTNPEDGHFRLAFDPTVPGTHAWRATSTGAVDSAEEGLVVVRRALLGLAPIEVDPTTPVGMVRLLTTDLDEDDPLLSDAQITAVLALEAADVRLAAAQLLDSIATSEALVSKKIRTQDLATDGPAVAAELRARAAELRRQSDSGQGSTSDDADFSIVTFDWC